MFRFLHLADVHLDTTFLCRSDRTLRGQLRDALREAFREAVDYALERRLNAVLIAGDLFDNDRLSFATEQFLLEQLHRLDAAGINGVYVTGNHDPGGEHFRTAKIDWPDSFHYINDHEPQEIELIDADDRPIARVIGAGHRSSAVSSNLAAQFPAADGDLPHVGLLHAMVTSAAALEGHERYAPCTLDDLTQTEYDYWALGHIHARQQVDSGLAAWFPGNLQGRHVRETGLKGGLAVSLTRGQSPEVEFVPFAPIRWEEIVLSSLETAHNLSQLKQAVREAFEEVRQEDDGRSREWMLRVRLTGPCPLADRLAGGDEREELEAILGSELGVLDLEIKVERLSPPIDVDTYRDDTHLVSAVLAMIDELSADPEQLEQVVPEPLAGAEFGKVNTADYLERLLTDLDREAVLRLINSDHAH